MFPSALVRAAAAEVTDDARCWNIDDMEGDEAEIGAIRLQFARLMLGLRSIPAREKAAALKAAKDWRTAAFIGVKERRRIERHARRDARRKEMPTPR